MLVWFRNSIVVGVMTSVGCLTLGIPAAYAFSRFRFRGSTAVLMLIVASQMFPLILVLISLYLVYRDLKLLDTLPGLALAFMTFAFQPLAQLVEGWPRVLLQQLSIRTHFHDFVRGMVDVNHLVFFVTMTGLFLFLSVKLLEMRRWR